MANMLKGKRIAFIAADGVEQVELTAPWNEVESQGGMPELISIKPGRIQAVKHMDKAETFRVDRTFDDASPDE